MVQQVKLGAFVLVGLALFLIAVFFIGAERNIFNRTFTVVAVFRNVEGLKEGDNVWLSGVKVGTVSDVRIVELGKVVVTLSLRHRQNEFIRTDATAFIGSDGFVGNKIVVIRPGLRGKMIQDSDTIHSESPVDTQELINIARDVCENTRTLTEDLGRIAAKLNDGRGILAELLNNGSVSQELRLAVTDLRSASRHTNRVSAELQVLVHEMRKGTGLLSALVNDTALSQAFADALSNIQRVSDHAAAVADDLESFTHRMNEHNSLAGVILADTTAAAQLRQTVRNAEQATRKLEENMEALRHNFLLRGYFRRQERRQRD